jgi:hypothetical protein
MKPRKHAELIKAWADGATIERLWNDYNGRVSSWLIDNEPDWSEFEEYRIKPEPKPDVFKNFMLVSHPLAGLKFSDVTGLPRKEGEQWIRVYIDGETGELKSAEVLK